MVNLSKEHQHKRRLSMLKNGAWRFVQILAWHSVQIQKLCKPLPWKLVWQENVGYARYISKSKWSMLVWACFNTWAGVRYISTSISA